jgi:hypothetical protein
MRVLTLCLLGLGAYAADPRESAVMAARAVFSKCWNARDTACLSKLVTDDFVQVTRTARLMDKTGFLEGMKAGRYSRTEPGTPEPPERERKIRFYGNVAIVTSVQAGTGLTYGGTRPAQVVDHYGTEVWTLVDGKWLLATMHVSFPPAPPPQ